LPEDLCTRVNDLFDTDRRAVASLCPALAQQLWVAAVDAGTVAGLRRYLGEGARLRGAFLQPAPSHDPLAPLAVGVDGVVRSRQVRRTGMEGQEGYR
jgi:hypothetical protein